WSCSSSCTSSSTPRSSAGCSGPASSSPWASTPPPWPRSSSSSPADPEWEVAAVLAAVTDPNVWKFRPHPEVWLLVAFLVGAYLYAIRVIGPRFVRPGQPVVRSRQVACFVAGMALLWAASDWPIHDVG